MPGGLQDDVLPGLCRHGQSGFPDASSPRDRRHTNHDGLLGCIGFGLRWSKMGATCGEPWIIINVLPDTCFFHFSNVPNLWPIFGEPIATLGSFLLSFDNPVPFHQHSYLPCPKVQECTHTLWWACALILPLVMILASKMFFAVLSL